MLNILRLKWFLSACLTLSTSKSRIEVVIAQEIKKERPSSRIRTSDLRITINTLQSSALPTELSKEYIRQIVKL